MRVVLDTNILVSALITKGTPPDQLYVDPDEAAQMVAAIHQRAIVLSEVPVTKRSPDPKDDPILAAAVAGDAGLVVSGDRSNMLALGDLERRIPRSTSVLSA